LFTADGFDDEFPIYPIREIESIQYDSPDADGVTLSLADVHMDLSGKYPTICPVSSWPTLASGRPGAVRITATVGSEDVPEDFKSAVLLRAKELYAMRGESLVGASVEAAQLTFEALLEPYKRY
jgi:hypothetical protein